MPRIHFPFEGRSVKLLTKRERGGREQAITLSLPPMSAAIYKCTRKFPSRRKKTAEAAPKAAKSGKTAKAAPKKTTRKSKES